MRRWKPIALAAVAVMLILAISGIALAGGPGWKTGSSLTTSAVLGALGVSEPGTATLAPLSDAEKEALLFMREEEKLARDVYAALYTKWNIPVFSNIAASETRHMASIKTLLDRYGLADPVAVDTPGVFVNVELQAAYTQLVAQGSQSLMEALKVGVTIETLDIEDLEEVLTISTHPDVTQVAGNLLRGSQNHMEAFTRLMAE